MNNHNNNDPNIYTPFAYNQSDIWVQGFTDEDVYDFNDKIKNSFEENPAKPIIIHIKTYGGSVHGLFSMLDIMDAYRDMAPEGFGFVTYAVGQAMSAGALLLACGDIRFAAPSCSLMIHQIISGTGWGLSHPDNEIEFKEQTNLNNSIIKVLQEHIKAEKADLTLLKSLIDRNWYLSPKEAFDLGLIDIIGSPKLFEHKSYELRVLNGTPLKSTPKKKKSKKVSSSRRKNEYSE